MIPFTFLELYQLHHFKVEDLACEAQVPAIVVDLMLQGQPVSREAAKKVLKALSLLTRRYYTLANVMVALVDDNTGGVASDYGGRSK